MSCPWYFSGGKGGVGKTTCASAFALAAAADRRRGQPRILLVSTDPAHSLSDALSVKLSAKPTRIRPGLDALELDAPRAFARWLTEHRAALGQILEHGTWLDADDVDALLDLAIPGIDELVGLLEIMRITATPVRAARAPADPPIYDLIVVDSAPTGHTLRLLAAPETVAAVAGILDTLQAEHRLIRRQFARVLTPEAADALIVLLAEQAAGAAARLRDPRRTTLKWVTLPEALALAETENAVSALDRRGFHVSEIVVNRVMPADGGCDLCRRRLKEERSVITRLREGVAGKRRPLRAVAAFEHEPIGLSALTTFGQRLAEPSTARKVAPGLQRGPADSRRARHALNGRVGDQPAGPLTSCPFDPVEFFRGMSLLFVGGKGGVGKTTVAAACALRLARANPQLRVLLLSTDPAHSIADVLATRADRADRDGAQQVVDAPDNLLMRELDASRALAARRGLLESALAEIASSAGTAPGMTAVATPVFDRAALEKLMRLAPPGIDELFGFLSVIDARAEFEIIVVDTAPTGHALRLLEMPDDAREWTQALLRILMKYRGLVRPGRLAAEIVELSRSIRELQLMLRDHVRTGFVVVTRAAELPRVETTRLLTRLHRLHLATPAVVVNARTLTPGACRRCQTTAGAERRQLALLRNQVRRAGRRLQGCAIIETPLSAPPPRGALALARWVDGWICHGR